jgi:hypothetical protein
MRDLLDPPGDPAAMGHLARALLARLLARRGDPGAARLLAEATGRPHALEDVVVSGPLAAAAVERARLQGDVAGMPDLAADPPRRAAEARHRGAASELCGYLQHAGHPVAPPVPPIGPWAPALAGRPSTRRPPGARSGG